jgi:DDE superfamily endonuclease
VVKALKEKLLDIYSDYLISQNKHATATGLSELLSGTLSHDQITRFLHSGEYGSKELWQYVKGLVRQQEGTDEGVLIIDDTVEEKAYTDENEVMCWHYSYNKGRHVKGMNLLSGLIRYGDISIPVGYEIIKKDIRFCDVESKSEKRKSSVNKNELFRKLVKQAISNEIKFSYVLADNWFSSKETVKFIHYDCHKYFILGIKSNRTVATSLEDRQKGDFKRIESLNIQDNTALTVWLKEVDFPVKLLKKVFINENGSIGILYLITNDLSLESTRFYDLYQKRWCIEEYHKSIKQNASLAKSPTKVIRSQCNHIFSTLIAYCKLEKLKIKTKLNHFAIKYKLLVRANQIAFQELKNLTACLSTA